MESFMTALTGTNGLTDAVLWGVVQNTIPMIVFAVGFALGFGIIRKLFKGVAKGKVRA